MPRRRPDSTHSADLDYAELLPSLLQLNLTNKYVSLAAEPDRRRVLEVLRTRLTPGKRIFIAVMSPIDPRIESAEEVRDRVLETAAYIPVAQPARGPGSRHGDGRGDPESERMSADEEDKALGSAALQNVQHIIQLRQRAEYELVRTKEALEEEKRILEVLNNTGACSRRTWSGSDSYRPAAVTVVLALFGLVHTQ